MLPLLLARLASSWRGIVRELTDPYRPELHYMRGPGPKCRARQADGSDEASGMGRTA